MAAPCDTIRPLADHPNLTAWNAENNGTWDETSGSPYDETTYPEPYMGASVHPLCRGADGNIVNTNPCLRNGGWLTLRARASQAASERWPCLLLDVGCRMFTSLASVAQDRSI